MADRRASKTFLTDEEKSQVLYDLKNKLTPSALTSDLALASELSQISSKVHLLTQSAETTSDLNFTVNLVDYTVDCVATHLESNDPNRELFHELVIADGTSMTSWCPGGYLRLIEITQGFRPVRIGFQKFIALKDLEENRGDPKETSIREKKKRIPNQLNKAPTVVPTKITATEEVPSHELNLKTALNVLQNVASDSRIPYFRFVLNPRSFVQSVYNIFIVSFLVHERAALLSVDNDELFIQASSAAPDDSPEDAFEDALNIQLIQSLSPKEWMALVQHLSIDSPMLPEFCPKNSPDFVINQLSDDLANGVVFLNP